jgi:glycosyltransferase involved in cell wall biosynthesis
MKQQKPEGGALRVLEILEPSGGGSGRHFLDLSAALKARGHHVEAVYSPLRAEARFVGELQGLGLDGVHAIDMRRAPGPSDIAAWLKLERLIQSRGPFDVIHGHSSKAGALSRLSLAGRKAARIYTPHAFRTMDPGLGRGGRLLFGGIERLLGRNFGDALIAVSRDEFAHALALGLPADRIHLVVNGTHPPPLERRPDTRKRLGLRPDSLVFGFIGRLSRQKAPERLIAAFNLMAGRLPDAELAMIGFGELEPMVSELISASPFSRRIHLDGAIPGPDAIAAFDILVMPSRYEAMSYVMLEAEAAAKPMILTDVGGAATVLDDGRNGILVANVDDPADLAEAMLAAGQPERLAAFRLEADRRKNRHSIDQMVEETIRVYRAAMAR